MNNQKPEFCRCSLAWVIVFVIVNLFVFYIIFFCTYVKLAVDHITIAAQNTACSTSVWFCSQSNFVPFTDLTSFNYEIFFPISVLYVVV